MIRSLYIDFYFIRMLNDVSAIRRTAYVVVFTEAALYLENKLSF
jgi:hypothetical protein